MRSVEPPFGLGRRRALRGCLGRQRRSLCRSWTRRPECGRARSSDCSAGYPRPRCRYARPSAGDERTPLERRLRRARLRRELRRARRRPRAGRLRRPRARHRPLRDRRAPDLRLRRPDRVARRRWASTDSIRQTFGELVVHTPHVTARMGLPFTFSTFDYRELCAAALRRSRRRVRDRQGRRAATGDTVVHTDRGDLTAPLVVDALGWRRILAAATATSRPTRRSRAGSRSTPGAPRTSSRSGSTATTSPPATAGAFPRRDEVRVGVGSFDPRFHVKEPTVRLAERPRARRRSATRATGSRTSCAPRPTTGSSSPATRPATACR